MHKDSLSICHLPEELLIYILLYTGEVKYWGYFSQASKHFNGLLNQSEAKSVAIKIFWSFFYRLERNNFNKALPENSHVCKELYKNAFIEYKQKEEKRGFTKQYRELFHWIHKGQLSSIKKYQWSPFRDFYKITNLNGFNAIHFASINNQEIILKYFYKKITKNNLGDTFQKLYFAAACNNIEEVEKFNDTKLINKVNEEEKTPLHIATDNGHLKVIELLIKNGADINMPGQDGITPLHLAAKNNHIEILNYLISSGADINKRAEDKFLRPIQVVSYLGHGDIMGCLVSTGVEVIKTNKNGITPLHLAAKNGYFEVVESLIKSGADINLVALEGGTPLHLSTEFAHFECVKLLLSKGVDVNKVSQKGYTSLYVAVVKQNFKIAKLLVERNADVNKAAQIRCTPLYAAVAGEQLELTKFLLEKGAKINSPHAKSLTSLHMAAKSGNLDMVKLLVNNGADINKTTDKDETPIIIAKKNYHNKVFSFFKMLEIKQAAGNKNLLEKMLIILETPTDIRNILSPLTGFFFTKNLPLSMLIKQLKNLCKQYKEVKREQLFQLILRSQEIIPKDKYDFILEYLFEINSHELNEELKEAKLSFQQSGG